MTEVRAFSWRAPGAVRVLQTQVGISEAHQPTTPPGISAPTPQVFMAIWDTGATSSVITQNVVDACGLKQVGMTMSHHAQGVSQVPTYAVNIFLPNGVQFPIVPVTLGVLPPGTDALIGMDIIAAGDFVLSTAGGETMFSYRYPALGVPDFVVGIDKMNAKQAARMRLHGHKNNASGPTPLHQKTPPRSKRKKR